MQPLLSIQTQPIQISYSTQRAQLTYDVQLPQVEITRIKGKSEIRREPIQVKMDSYEMRASMGLKSTQRSIQEFAQAGKSAAMEATRGYAEQGNQIMDSHGKGNPIADIAMSKMMRSTETIMSFLPSERVNMWVEGGGISFDYTMDKLEFNWQVHVRPQMEYVPGKVNFSVTQYPDVIIEYLGSPIYVPPSADPNYVPPPSLDQTA